METYILLGFVLILSIYLGLELISKVPSTLHTPLMSGANAISGISIVGALLAANNGEANTATILAFFAIVLATINVVGGFLVISFFLLLISGISRITRIIATLRFGLEDKK